MIKLEGISISCQPKSGTHGRNKRKSYCIVFISLFYLQDAGLSAFYKVFEFLF